MNQTIGIIIQIALLVLTGLAAAGTLAQANVAKSARDDAEAARDETKKLAERATVAAERHAAAVEEQVELEKAKLKPDDWTPHDHGGNRYSLTNSSKRTIHVVDFQVSPDSAAGAVTAHDEVVGQTFNYGESFQFSVHNRFTLNARLLTLRYRFNDDAAADVHELLFPIA